MCELVLRAHIQDRCGAGAQPVEQLIARYRLELVPCAEIARNDPRDLGAVALADPAESKQKADDALLSGEAVVDALTLAPALDERRAAKELQVAVSIGSAPPAPRGSRYPFA